MDKFDERRILLKRFFWRDRDLYNFGKLAGLRWFDKFDHKFSRDIYAYFATEEKQEALEQIVNQTNDTKFIEVLNKLEIKYLEIDRFLGEHYFYERNGEFVIADKRDDLRKDVKNALEETKERGYYFLKAIIELKRDDRWDKAYGGASWVDILAKIRELGGKYPSPRDIAILKSYRIYYRTGSRRYPTHTVPEEMISAIGAELMKSRES